MAGQGTGFRGRLGHVANRLVAENAQNLARLSGKGLTLEQRAGRVWDIPAKVEVAHRIADEEERRAGRFARNDERDAMRHARWSQRTAATAGPVFAELAGDAHEVGNFAESVLTHGVDGPYKRKHEPGAPPTPGATMDEIRMDLHNNAEGRRAALERRPIDPAKLQTWTDTPVLSVIYREPPSGRTFSGHR